MMVIACVDKNGGNCDMCGTLFCPFKCLATGAEGFLLCEKSILLQQRRADISQIISSKSICFEQCASSQSHMNERSVGSGVMHRAAW